MIFGLPNNSGWYNVFTIDIKKGETIILCDSEVPIAITTAEGTGKRNYYGMKFKKPINKKIIEKNN